VSPFSIIGRPISGRDLILIGACGWPVQAVERLMPDHFLCFAYGSNMLNRRIQAADRAPSAQSQGTGFVAAHRLTFDKVSTEKKSGRQSGKCDMEATGQPADLTYGVVFSIPKTEEAALDKAEGVGKGYEKRPVTVTTDGGEVAAIAYIATKTNPGVRPYDWYHAFVLAGAIEHGLPPDYVAWLRTIETQRDPDEARRASNAGLLEGTGVSI
jgi:cation transport regulator ChaC